MGQLVEEVKQWNTPVVGAFLLWRFTQGYSKAHPAGDAPIVLLHFVASAILSSRQLLDSISNRRRNLQSFVRGFEENRKSDLLLGLQQRILDKRTFTLSSIDLAVSSGLLTWDLDSAKLHPRELLNPPKRGNALKVALRRDGDKAEILGKWFSDHDLSTIAAYMEIVF